jgi:hypothetical protein
MPVKSYDRMIHRRKRKTVVRQFWLGCILLSTALGSTAASLGRQSGAAVIGRPLDVRMQILLGPNEAADSLCLAAEVIYGDTPLPGSAVVVTTQRSTPDAELSVRVQSSRAVNEPFVYVNLRAGCTAPFARQYVFLADPATDEPRTEAPPARAPLPAAELPVAPAGSGAVAGATVPVARAPDNSGAPTARLRVQPDPNRPAAAPVPPSTPRSVVRRPAAVATAPAPRLQLDPVDIDLTIERSPTLRLSDSMLSQPTDSEETRAAARSLWQALNASPEDILRDAQKLTVLEAEIQGLRSEEAKNTGRLAELSAAADRARYLNWLVFLLAGLLLVAVAGLVWLWRRQVAASSEAAKAWWSEGSKAEMAAAEPSPVEALSKRPDTSDLDFDLDVDSGYGEPLDAGGTKNRAAGAHSKPDLEVPAKDRKEFSPSAIGGSRSVATEELFDVQQQADFFVSLGEVDQAIQVLLNHLAESFEPSPLAYLDLFKLYHRQNQREEYERLRTEFNELFNAGAPPFEQYSDQSRGLESYETAFTRIQALWPEPRVLDVIEQSIFRDAGSAEGEVFDLEAYRELLLLHAIAKDLVKREVETPQSSFRHTKVQPLKAAGPVAEEHDPLNDQSGLNGRNTVPMEASPPASTNLGLDIDLVELDAFASFEASLPEVSAPVEPTAQPRRDDSRSSRGASGLIDFDLLDFTPPDDTTGRNNGGSR